MQRPSGKRLQHIIPLLLIVVFAALGYGIFLGKNNATDPDVSASALYPADINSDGTVGIADLSYLIGKWGTADTLADVNIDGRVNIFDLSLVISRWGATGAAIPSPDGWRISWVDDFEGSSVDSTRWGVYDPSNGKGRYGSADPMFLPCLTNNNAVVTGGNLTIMSKKEQYACGSTTTQYTSGFLGSRDANRYYPLYGRYEIRARIPHGQGIWPAFWLRHVNGASAAEVDIVEVFHHTDPGSVTQTLHFPNSLGQNIAKKGLFFENAVKGSGSWHTFAVDIEQVYAGRDDTVKFTFWIDNTKTLEYTNNDATSWTGVTDKSRVWDIALNTAVGGTYAGHPDEKLGWDTASGGRCALERPQRSTVDFASCSKERTASKWYNDIIPKAPSPDGVDDIWYAPWHYSNGTAAEYIIDYVRVYTK